MLVLHSAEQNVCGLYFSKSPKPDAQKEKGKKPRVWDLGNSNAKVLDYSNSTTNGNSEASPMEEFEPDMVRSQVMVSALVCSGVSRASLRLAEKVLEEGIRAPSCCLEEVFFCCKQHQICMRQSDQTTERLWQGSVELHLLAVADAVSIESKLGKHHPAVATSQCAAFILQALKDRNREPGRLYDLEYESDEEAEEEKIIQNASKPR